MNAGLQRIYGELMTVHLSHVPWKLCLAAIPRGMALFLGLFALLNVAGGLRTGGFDANIWWIRLPVQSPTLDAILLAWAGCCLLWTAAHQRLSSTMRLVLTGTFCLLLAGSLWNVMRYYQLLSVHSIETRFPWPFSLIVTLCLGLLTAGVWWPAAAPAEASVPGNRLPRAVQFTVCVACAVAFPLGQMYCFGSTDYRRPADMIVVFGAGVHPSGRLSSILEERVRTGCALYHQQLAPRILFSGGPGKGQIHETSAMRRRALELGVPAEVILLDPTGMDTESTAITSIRLAREQGWRKILAVSQFYHLPRIKLAFHRHGAEVYTVPATPVYRFRALPYFMAREVAAWWLYYIRP